MRQIYPIVLTIPEEKMTFPPEGLQSCILMAIIHDIDKGGGEIIRIETSEYRGKQYLNLRVWYTDKQSGEFKPTQKGVTLRPELYEELKEAVLKAEPEIQKMLAEGGA